MKRRYSRDLFESRVLEIREAIPLAGIGADVIVGFPGETENDSEDTYNFLSNLPLSYLHVFNFSERPGTPAIKMEGKVPFYARDQRSKKLISLSKEKQSWFSRLNIGTRSRVLFEGNRKNGMISGFTENYLKVEYPWDVRLSGTIRTINITGIDKNDNLIIELTD
jgi:threonylcarbamoyladenosine tRNA methylthiotransferase MtaB